MRAIAAGESMVNRRIFPIVHESELVAVARETGWRMNSDTLIALAISDVVSQSQICYHLSACLFCEVTNGEPPKAQDTRS